MNHVLLVGTGLVCVAVCYLSYRHYAAATALLHEWAHAHQLCVLHARRGGFLPRPWMLTTSRYQVVYHVSLYDESTHRIRGAWVRLGTRYWGVMDPGAIEVRWDDAS